MDTNLIPYGTMTDSSPTFRSKRLTKFEERINEDFGCYYCFVYFELLTSLLMIMFDFLPLPSAKGSTNSYILQWLAGVCMITACILVISAKKKYGMSKVKTALKLFYLGLIFGIIEGLVDTSEHLKLFSKAKQDVPFVILIAFPLAMILDILLIAQTDKLIDLMGEKGYHHYDTEMQSF